MANRAFRRMVEQRRDYLNYQSPILEQYENKLQEQQEAPKEPEQEVPEIEQNKPAEPMRVQPVEKIGPSLEYEVLAYRKKLEQLASVWGDYKKLITQRVDSSVIFQEDVFQCHNEIEKILSEKP